ncbi:MAG: Stk1 family PASTA domain-containing Ser/Thr kinase, partial [Ornithinimicrobium sp.]|uniref:Stk1 family PASTA domain-containing Ser/Thr kinase n=1 Tax=Ornithinimicrobium sp. TaxID=1977084 RepID=UPI0026DEDA71
MTDDPTQSTPPPQEGRPPRVLGGRYEIGDLIGRGGMADVHAGHDLRLGRTVAIKILRSDLARDTSFIARFRREAQSAAGLSHPSIVGVFDSGEETTYEAGGAPVQVPYIVMEYVDGRTLRELLNQSPGKVLVPDEAARITAAVLSALEYAHDRGIVHRDIKPANVMITDAGVVKVMDFGIARALADTAATMTQTSAVMGTARYLSPEQAQGLSVDGRSDLYSVGCLLYELLVGRTPFQGDPVSLVYQHLGEIPKLPSSFGSHVPEPLEAITLHALEKTPEGRYQSAAAFRADLAAYRTDRPLSKAAQASLASVIGPAAGGVGAGAAAMARAQRAGASTAAVPTADGGVDGYDERSGLVPGLADGGGRQPERRDGAPGRGGSDPTSYQDDRYERTDEMPVREQRHRGAGMLLGVLALLAVAGVAWVLFQVFGPGGGPPEPTQVVVQSTIGKTQAQAKTILIGDGFTIGEVNTRFSEKEKDTVIDQDPPGGLADEGSAVSLVISGGPESITIPDLTGWEEDAARAELDRLGFENVSPKAKSSDNPDYNKGTVISTTPAANESALPQDPIQLEVASGKVKVPELEGKTRDQAIVLLYDADLKYEIELQQTWDVEAGIVLDQSRAKGERVKKGTTITLIIAEQPPRTVEVTTTTTVSPPPPAPTSEVSTSEPAEPTTDPPTTTAP